MENKYENVWFFAQFVLAVRASFSLCRSSMSVKITEFYLKVKFSAKKFAFVGYSCIHLRSNFS